MAPDQISIVPDDAYINKAQESKVLQWYTELVRYPLPPDTAPVICQV